MQPLPSEHHTFMETIFHKHVGVKRDNSFSLTEQLHGARDIGSPKNYRRGFCFSPVPYPKPNLTVNRNPNTISSLMYLILSPNADLTPNLNPKQEGEGLLSNFIHQRVIEKNKQKRYTINTKIQSICKIFKRPVVCSLQDKLQIMH